MATAPPKVTVLLPVRDAREHIEEALASVRADAAPPGIEILVIDDGSRDGTAEILRSVAREEPRLRVITTPPRGLVGALNRGLVEARAPVVVRMDADDRSLPGRIPRLLEFLDARPRIALVGSGVALHPEGQAARGMRRYVDWLNRVRTGTLPREIWIEAPLAHPTVALRREVVLAAGGYREGPFAEDYELLLRLAARGHGLAKVDEVLYWWRDHPRRLTRTSARYAPQGFRHLKVGYLKAGPLAGRPEVAVWGAGKTGRPLARVLREHGLGLRAWIDVDPRKIGRPLHGAPVLGVESLSRLRGIPLLVAVGTPGARELIRAELARRSLRELEDYWVIA